MIYDKNSGPILESADPDEPTCPDLAALFGNRFKIGHDPAYFVEHGRLGRSHDPWLLTVECQHGHIYPHDVDTLAASTKCNGSIATAVAALDCTSVIQDGSDGINATFRVRDFDTVAAVMKPRKKHIGRPLTPEARAKLVKMGRANIKRINEDRLRAQKPALESHPSTPDVQTPTQPHPIA